MGKLLIRADANESIGTGHVMRCLALAQAWQSAGGETLFALTRGAEVIVSALTSFGTSIKWLEVAPGSDDDAQATVRLAREKNAKWLAVDGYCFGVAYQEGIKQAKLSLFLMDDNASLPCYCADMVLNQNLGVTEHMYSKRDSETRLLLGPRYALLRQEFLQATARKRNSAKQATRLLVTLGGADPENVTSQMISAIHELNLPDLEARIVLGPLNRNLSALQKQVYGRRDRITLVSEQADMPALMAWADVAISGAGSTSWELCFMSVPSLLIVLARNQERIANELEKEGAAINLGRYQDISFHSIAAQLQLLLLNAELRSKLATHASRIVDGKGAQRVVTEIHRGSLTVRRVQHEDCRLLWEWANDPEVRKHSFSNSLIAWKEHVAWFTRKLADRDTIFLIAEAGDGQPAGQVRLELLPQNEAVIHISIAPLHRSFGFGGTLIERVVQEFSSPNNLYVFHAYIRPDNVRSIAVFERSGFSLVSHEPVHGIASLHFSRHVAERAIAS